MRFQLALLAVQDAERSKRFYHDLFGQEVAMDLGRNVTFSGGFAIQEDFAWLTDLPEDSVKERSHNMELYFETEDFDGFLSLLDSHPEVELIHHPKKHPWQQRVVRLYDPDGHIMEVGESMGYLAKRYLREGLSVRETAALIQHPEEFVEACRRELEKEDVKSRERF